MIAVSKRIRAEQDLSSRLSTVLEFGLDENGPRAGSQSRWNQLKSKFTKWRKR